MELWIRSQDKKKLIKVDEVKIETVKDGNTFIYSHATDLGTYETKERALEVLDEIQKILEPKTIIGFRSKPQYLEDGTINDLLIPEEKIDCINQLSTYVYQMPEE